MDHHPWAVLSNYRLYSLLNLNQTSVCVESYIDLYRLGRNPLLSKTISIFLKYSWVSTFLLHNDQSEAAVNRLELLDCPVSRP